MSDLPEGVAQGQRLSVYLRPNHDTLETEEPEYHESYGLPFVYAEGGYVSGVTRSGHMIRNKAGSVSTVGFNYTNAVPIYSIIFSQSLDNGKIHTKLNSSKQYREVSFRLLPAGPLHFEKNAAAGTEPKETGLRRGIRDGVSHYAVLGTDDGRVISAPVDLSYDYHDTGTFEFRTELMMTSSHTLKPLAFRNSLLQNPKVGAAIEEPLFNVLQQLPVATTYLKIRDDGTYDTLDEEGLRYDWLRVYAYP